MYPEVRLTCQQRWQHHKMLPQPGSEIMPAAARFPMTLSMEN